MRAERQGITTSTITTEAMRSYAKICVGMSGETGVGMCAETGAEKGQRRVKMHGTREGSRKHEFAKACAEMGVLYGKLTCGPTPPRPSLYPLQPSLHLPGPYPCLSATHRCTSSPIRCCRAAVASGLRRSQARPPSAAIAPIELCSGCVLECACVPPRSLACTCACGGARVGAGIRAHLCVLITRKRRAGRDDHPAAG